MQLPTSPAILGEEVGIPLQHLERNGFQVFNMDISSFLLGYPYCVLSKPFNSRNPNQNPMVQEKQNTNKLYPLKGYIIYIYISHPLEVPLLSAGNPSISTVSQTRFDPGLKGRAKRKGSAHIKKSRCCIPTSYRK